MMPDDPHVERVNALGLRHSKTLDGEQPVETRAGRVELRQPLDHRGDGLARRASEVPL